MLGLETLAIMFSLPYALLMWRRVISSALLSPISHRFPQYSMLSFLAAFLILCFQNSSAVVYSLIGSLCGVIAVLICWCIWTSWEEQPSSDAKPIEELLSFEQEEGSEEDAEEKQKNFTFQVVTEPTQEPQPSTLGLRLPLSFDWPFFLHRRRQSCDSNGTVVENP